MSPTCPSRKICAWLPPHIFPMGTLNPHEKCPHPCGAPSEPPAPHLRQLMLRRAASRNQTMFLVRVVFVSTERFYERSSRGTGCVCSNGVYHTGEKNTEP